MPSRSADHRPLVRLRSLAEFFHNTLGETEARLHRVEGSLAVIASSAGVRHFVTSPEGWMVLHGAAFRTDDDAAELNLAGLLETYLRKGDLPLDSLEGSYALACWDSRRQRGVAAADHAATARLYYIEADGGLYATTNALGLARALGLALDREGVADYLARGTLAAPVTLYEGLRRLNVGERIDYRADRGASVSVQWLAYREPARFRNRREAAEHLAAVLSDRVRRFAVALPPAVTDLSGGLDSRLVLLAGAHCGARLDPVVWGSEWLPDVRIARELASSLDVPLRHLSAEACADCRITPEVRRQLTALTGGDINFHGPHHLWLLHQQLDGQYGIHLSGFGGELLRYFPWSQEFLGIGRRRPASVENLIRYRFLAGGPPPLEIFRQRQWYAAFRRRLYDSIAGVCAAAPGARTTQQCDAVYVWKMTGHAAVYLSAAPSHIPYVAPMLTKGAVEAAVSVPWPMRLTTGLMRQMNARLSPRAADVPTTYGGTGAPLRPGNAHRFAWQAARQAGHLAAKLNRVALKGRLYPTPTRRPATFVANAYLTEEFQRFLTPEGMLTRRLYDAAALKQILVLLPQAEHAAQKVFLRLATLEEICQVLDFEPEGDFLCPSVNAASPLPASLP
jgi:hypothetical protein